MLTTHYLEEAEQLCDRIAIINHGKLIANKPTRELVGMAREKAVVLTLDRDVSRGTPPHAAFEKSELIADRTVEITYNKDRMNAGEVLTAMQGLGLGIIDVTTKEADLGRRFPASDEQPISGSRRPHHRFGRSRV